MLWAMCRDGTVYDSAGLARESEKGLRASNQDRALVAEAMSKTARKLARRGAPLRKRAAAAGAVVPARSRFGGHAVKEKE